MSKPPENVPKALGAMIDIVLAYKPKAKTDKAKKRKKLAAKIAKMKEPSKSPFSGEHN